ncbi:MAG: DUF362 domain-containing protein, partial [Clostridiales bacterium]|nr:DUF362 domain-containing protein [Clostridiales bacterium]
MNSNDKVFIAKCTTYSSELVQKSVERCIDAFGGMDTILNATGKRVLVKPNLIKAARVEEAATTNPAVVRAVCLMLKKSGAEITIYDSPAVGHTRAHLELLYRQTGMTAIAEEVGATLCTEPVSHSVDYNGRKLTISGAVISSDLIINIPKMKTHSFVGMTGAVKNLFGAVPGLAKSQSHAMNVDVNSFACLI